jgi:ribonuclease Y
VEPQSIEAVIVAAADAISGARPGARRESLDTYIKRVTALEEIGNSFPGVSQTYAIQAGREVRVLVRPEDVDDLTAISISKEIAKKIEDNLQYPGQIRVTVIRETRSTEYAK